MENGRTDDFWYNELNHWTFGLPETVTRVFHTKPFSLENWEANLDLFVSVVPSFKLESGVVDFAKGTTQAIGESSRTVGSEIRTIRSGNISVRSEESAIKSYGELGNLEDDIYESALTFRNNVKVRAAYINDVRALGDLEVEMISRGGNLEEIARTLHQKRRELGVKYKNMTSPETLEKIYLRNLSKYGDRLGPTFDYLIAKGKSFEEIIESSTRTGEEFNKKAGLSQGG